MKKSVIITVVAIFLIVGVIVTRLAFNTLSNDKQADGQVVQTEAPEAEETAKPVQTEEPTKSPEVEETEVPEEPTSTPEAEETEEPTATPETETAAPEVDYSKLSDDKLAEEIVGVITQRHPQVKAMTEKERAVYAVYSFNKDAKSSLYNYLTGSNNATAAYVSAGFEAVNAASTNELFEDFVDTYRIKLSNTKTLSKLAKDDYHFDVFDEEYAEIAKNENLTSLLASYIKNNLDDLK